MPAIRTIHYSSYFVRAFQKLPAAVQTEASKREAIFRANCFDARLKMHKLKGRCADHWSFSVGQKYRIMFRFLTSDTVYFVDAGDHSIYQ